MRLQYSIASVIMDNYTLNIAVGKDISSAQKNLILISVATASSCSCLDESHFGNGTSTTFDVHICWMTANTISVVVMTLVNQYDL